MIGTNSMEDKKMKKITFAILAIAFIAAFNSCKEEEEIQTPDDDNWEYFVKQYDENTPHTPGTFIMFGANTYYKNGEVETRTQYSGEEITIGTNKYERIDWIDGDKLQIYCNQSSSGVNNAVYAINESTITVNEENRRQSVAEVTLDSEQGLKWGEADPHIFHGVYPEVGAIENTYPEVYENSAEAFKFISKVPSQQPYPVDMTLAGMVAKTTATLDQRGNVSMVYYPTVTTLQFDLINFSKSDIKINEIFIEAPEAKNEDLAGTYEIMVSADKPTISGTQDFSILCDPKDQISVVGINQELAKGSTDFVRVVMFALPVEFTHAKLGIKMTINGQKVTRKIALNYKETVEVDGVPTVVKKDIVFQPTHKYNFTIKIPDSTVFDVTPESYDYDVPGGAAPLEVTSYTYNAAGEKTPVAWTATRYSLDGGETWLDFGPSVLTPDAIGVLPTMLEGWDKFSFTDVEGNPTQFVTPVNGTVSYNKPPYRKLKEAAPANDVDLSMRDVNGNSTSAMNTANCYLVHARGTYKFPVVYGNGIKNGAINTIAFNPTMDRSAEEILDSITYSPYKKIDEFGHWITLPNEPYYSLTDDESRELYFGNTLTTEEKKQLFNVGWGKGWTMESNPAKNHFLSPFLNHTSQGITDPWLKNNTGVNPTTATLLWQDSKGLIKNVTLDGDYVKFEVTSDFAELVEGNALIAVTDGTNILWNWHIWITEVTEDQNIESTDSPYGNVYAGQTMAATLIGKKVVENSIPKVTDAKIAAFLGLCDLSVSPKEIKIEFVQEGTEATEIVTLKQKGLFDMNAPFYQFGRKDPLRFQKGINGDDRTVFKDLYTITNELLTASSFPAFSTSTLKDAVFEGIKKPLGQCKNNGLDATYFNLWAARLTRPGRYDAVRADKTKTVYDPCPAGYRVPSLADVAGWAGNNNSDGYNPRTGASRYYAGRIWQGWSESTPYAIMNIDGESKRVYVPFLQGAAVGKDYTTARLLGSWRLTETASWVSTPAFFSCAGNAFTDVDVEPDISYPSYDNGQYRRTETFYWYYHRTQYYQSISSHWEIADQSIHQIRFGGNVWMNEPGANKNNAVNVFMVKERDTDTCSDEYHQETQN